MIPQNTARFHREFANARELSARTGLRPFTTRAILLCRPVPKLRVGGRSLWSAPQFAAALDAGAPASDTRRSEKAPLGNGAFRESRFGIRSGSYPGRTPVRTPTYT
jgi:hypothetical protein